MSALEENFRTLRELGVTGAEDIARPTAAMLSSRGSELRSRALSGSVRDGHGDLRAEHVVLQHGIEVVDCVEFDPSLREIDVGFDLASLAMDLSRRHEHLARELVAAYRECGGIPATTTWSPSSPLSGP